MSDTTTLPETIPAPRPPLGRLSRGRLMQTATGHACTFQPTNLGYWLCGHNFVIATFNTRAAEERLRQTGAGDAQTGPGGSSAAPTPAPETPACPTTTAIGAGRRSGVIS